MSTELTEAAVEINAIFENMSEDLLNKIPLKLKIFFKKIASPTYTFEYDTTKPLKEQDLLPKTKGLISLIYRDYICNDIEKNEFNKIYNNLLQCKNNIQYDANYIFQSAQNDHINTASSLILHEKKSWLNKFIDKLKNIFNK